MALNILNLKKANARISNGGRILEFDLTGSDGIPHMHGFRLPEARTESDEFSADTANSADPTARDFRDDDVSTLAGTRALFAFSQFAKAMATVAGDRLLSKDGKAAGVRAAGMQTLPALGREHVKLLQAAPGIEAQGANLLALPNADPAEGAWDIEIYKHWLSLEPTDKILFERSLHEPNSAREALALKRTPVRLLSPEAQKSVAAAWESHIARRQPEQWGTYQTAKANHEWAAEFVPYLARELRDPGVPGGGEYAVPRLDAYKILQPLGATTLLRIQPHEAQMFDAVIASEAARKAAA